VNNTVNRGGSSKVLKEEFIVAVERKGE